jgi:hypothetical protein
MPSRASSPAYLLPPIPALNLKATFGQKPQNQPSSSLIILRKSLATIVTDNTGINDDHLRIKS